MCRSVAWWFPWRWRWESHRRAPLPPMAKRSARRRAPFEATVSVLIGPQRDRAADDLVGGGQAEVAAVEAVTDLPIHEEDFAGVDAATALPDRQLAPGAVTFQRRAHLDAIDGDGEVRAANG